MKIRILFTLFAALLLTCSPASGQQEILNGAPEVPDQFKSEPEAMMAVLAGQVELIPRDDVAGEGIRVLKDIEYKKAGENALMLDLYLPENSEKPAPCLIFIHGGGWKSGNRNDYAYYTSRFAQKGYACATISYRFQQEAKFPAAVHDTKDAVRWVRVNASEYKIDPDKIAAIGGSAGGYLSMMAGYADAPELEAESSYPEVSSKVQAVVDLYGPTDLDTKLGHEASEVLNFLGKAYEEAPELYVLASPVAHVDKNDPPTLIFQGTVDAIVPVEQSDQLAGHLLGVGVPVVYDRIAGWPHTMDAAKVVNARTSYVIEQFLKRYLPLN